MARERKQYLDIMSQLAYTKGCNSIKNGGTRPFFSMMDQYFGNNSLEPFEYIFMAPLALSTLWRYPQRGSQM